MSSVVMVLLATVATGLLVVIGFQGLTDTVVPSNFNRRQLETRNVDVTGSPTVRPTPSGSRTGSPEATVAPSAPGRPTGAPGTGRATTGGGTVRTTSPERPPATTTPPRTTAPAPSPSPTRTVAPTRSPSPSPSCTKGNPRNPKCPKSPGATPRTAYSSSYGPSANDPDATPRLSSTQARKHAAADAAGKRRTAAKGRTAPGKRDKRR